MDNKERMIARLLTGTKDGSSEVRIAALLAIGESGMIGDDRLVNALEDASKQNQSAVRQASLTAIGNMLKNSNRQ